MTSPTPHLPTPPHGQRTPHFDYPIEVTATDIDLNNHANNVVYIRWVQEAATAHWLSMVNPTLAQTIGWVVTRHEIDYKKPAHLGDQLIVRTWVETMSTVTSERHCAIYRQNDTALLAKIRTTWCAINPTTERPMRLPPGLVNLFIREDD